jgi:hypothetical protein
LEEPEETPVTTGRTAVRRRSALLWPEEAEEEHTTPVLEQTEALAVVLLVARQDRLALELVATCISLLGRMAVRMSVQPEAELQSMAAVGED